MILSVEDVIKKLHLMFTHTVTLLTSVLYPCGKHMGSLVVVLTFAVTASNGYLCKT